MNSKFLLLTLTSLLGIGRLSGPQTDSIDVIRRTIRVELMTLIFKAFVGVVLTSAVVFAIFQVGRVLQTVFVQLEYGLILQLTTFSLVAISCLVGLYYLFDTRRDKRVIAAAKKAEDEALDFSNLAVKFAEGFAVGMDSSGQGVRPAKPVDAVGPRMDH